MIRVCSIFYCDRMKERVCCFDCPQHPYNGGRCRKFCQNSPDRCGAVDQPRGERKKRDDKLGYLAAKAVEKFGVESQIIVAIEELSELQKALTKYLRKGVCDEVIANIREEAVDVRIMLEQVEVVFGSDPVIRREKLKHLEALVNDAEKAK